MRVPYLMVFGALFLGVMRPAWADEAVSSPPMGVVVRLEAGLAKTQSTDWAMGGDLGETPVLGVAAGYRVNRFLRLELGFNDRSDLEYQGKDGTFQVAGNGHNRSLMGTAVVDLPVFEKVVPYIGLGAGRSWTTIETADYSQGALTGTRDGRSTSTWAWQWVAGVGIQLAPSIFADLGFRYFDAGTVKLGDVGQVAGVAGTFTNAQQGQLKTKEGLLGIRFEF